MALSEQEQRLLAQLEASLAADDPDLARTLSGSTAADPRTPRRLGLAGLGLALGLAALVAGVEVHPLLSVLGFVLMLLAVVSARSMVTATIADTTRASQRPAEPRQNASGPFPSHPRQADEGH